MSASDAAFQLGGFEGGEHRQAARLYPDMIGGGGHVHNGQFMPMFERARFDLFRLLERRDPDMRRERYERYLVAAIEQRFMRPVSANDDVVIATRIERVGRTSCELQHRVLRGEEVVASATVSLVFVGDDGRPFQQPRAWVDAFAKAADTGGRVAIHRPLAEHVEGHRPPAAGRSE